MTQGEFYPEPTPDMSSEEDIHARFADHMNRINADISAEEWRQYPSELKNAAVIAANAEAGEICRKFGIEPEEWAGFTPDKKRMHRVSYRESIDQRHNIGA